MMNVEEKLHSKPTQAADVLLSHTLKPRFLLLLLKVSLEGGKAAKAFHGILEERFLRKVFASPLAKIYLGCTGIKCNKHTKPCHNAF